MKILSLVKKEYFNLYFSLFALIGLITLLFSPIPLSPTEKLTAFAYWLRLVTCWSLYFIAKALKNFNCIKYLGWVGIMLALIGWGQYFFYPDLRPLEYLGWDPHYKRIFGVFLDPNFMGIMLVLSLIIWGLSKSSLRVWLIRLFLLLTLAFTYSRSSFLALAVTAAFYAITKKKLWVIGVIGIIGVIGWATLPRPEGEGVRLERTASIEARLVNWQEGLQMWQRYPLGVGYNALRYARNQPTDNHAGAGWDNSLLVIATTTGVFGLITYLLFLRAAWQQSTLLLRLTLVALLTHSFFINSLFFPVAMTWTWIIISQNTSSRKYTQENF